MEEISEEIDVATSAIEEEILIDEAVRLPYKKTSRRQY
jgi:hypothetical protein